MKKVPHTVLYVFPLIKLLLHALTASTYPFHRDEYLYLDLGNHLAWGYQEVPPVIAVLAAFANQLGASVWLTRMLPALAGALLIYLACRLVRDLGGGVWAILFTGVGLLATPALLGTNSLFQPVSFNQLCWFLTAYLTIQLVRQERTRGWYALGLVLGLGMLTKYSLALYGLALLLGIFLTPHRRLLLTRHFGLAMGIALIIFLPNLYWQYTYNWPVFRHMAELRETQLVHMDWASFLVPQLLFHFSLSLIWLSGWIGVFFVPSLKPYRFVAWALLFTVFLIGFLSGKGYYTIGAYYILFPMGGIALEYGLGLASTSVVPVWRKWIAAFLLVGAVGALLPVAPYFLSILPVDRMQAYCIQMRDQYGLDIKLRWEDGVMRDLPQDIADMHGWEEMVQKVAKFYHQLSPVEQQSCHIYGISYGHAGAINYFREKYNLPEAHSINSSYLFWVPRELEFSSQLLIHDQKMGPSDWFSQVELIDSVANPYARDPGYIYWRSQPFKDMSNVWRDYVDEARTEAGF